MTKSNEILTPTEAAEILGVRTAFVIQAMYEKRLPRVPLDDGTLGVPSDSLERFRHEAAAGAIARSEQRFRTAGSFDAAELVRKDRDTRR